MAPGYGVPMPKKTNTLAIVSIISGGLGLICFGILGGIVALVTGIIGLRQINADPEHQSGKGIAIAGIVLGAISTIATVLFLVVFFASGG